CLLGNTCGHMTLCLHKVTRPLELTCHSLSLPLPLSLTHTHTHTHTHTQGRNYRGCRACGSWGPVAGEYVRGGRGRGGGYKHEKEGYGTVNCFGNHWHISGPRITFWSEWCSLGQNQLKTPGLDVLGRGRALLGLSRSGVLNRRTPVQIWTQTQSNLDPSQNQHSNLTMIQASFQWCVISRYIFFSYLMWFLSSVSNPEVQSGTVITTSLAMTTHSLNVGRELCGSRRLCVSMATTRADRFVNGIFFSTNENHGVL